MKYPRHAKALVTSSQTFALVTYAFFGVFGYLVYGSELSGVITLNLSGHNAGTVM